MYNQGGLTAKDLMEAKVEEEYISTKEAAEYLGVSRAMLYKHVGANRLTVYRQKGNNKLSFFSRAELKNLKEAKSKPEFIPVPKQSPVAA
jgi:excisionase family DNA binding protein